MIENWKDIVGFENSYQVSDLGRVRSIPRISSNGRKLRGKVLSQKNNKGYMQVIFSKNGMYSWHIVHRLVYQAFNGDLDPNLEIDHIDDVAWNNDKTNLRQITHKENVRKHYLPH